MEPEQASSVKFVSYHKLRNSARHDSFATLNVSSSQIVGCIFALLPPISESIPTVVLRQRPDSIDMLLETPYYETLSLILLLAEPMACMSSYNCYTYCIVVYDV